MTKLKKANTSEEKTGLEKSLELDATKLTWTLVAEGVISNTWEAKYRSGHLVRVDYRNTNMETVAGTLVYVPI